MERVKHIGRAIFYSLPIRLVIRQIRKHKILLLFWIILLGLLSGAIGESVGGPYLFLEPEYLGKENFWSVFMVGSALGGFLFAYMITVYINESYRFPFVASNRSPFYTLSFNNFLIPGTFIFAYFYKFIEYHTSVAGGFTWPVAEKVLGLGMGILFIFLFSASYFFANRTVIGWFGERLQKGFLRHIPRKRWVILGKARKSIRYQERTDNYLRFPFRIISVSSGPSNDLRAMVKSLSQNHGKLLMFQVAIFLLIAVLGLLENNRYFQIPAGASFLLIFSLAMMVSGAITFWFYRSGVMTIFSIAVVFVLYNNIGVFQEKNQAFGMDYQTTPAPYTQERLDEISSEEIYQQDRVATLQALDQWKIRYQEKYGNHQKPKAVLVCASGGGLRSAFWTFRVMQHLDSLTLGQFHDETRLMSGASGGMFGLAYFRELYMRRLKGEVNNIQDSQYSKKASRDLLNRIFFKIFTDILLPNRKVKMGEHTYDRETGYSFDQQLATNIPELSGRRIGDYTQWEKTGQIPTLILNPTILNQGKKLYISSSPVSFLTRASQITERYMSKSVGIEFRRLFENQSADSLLMTTALRMNATFPIILPAVELPSQPAMEVIDAGAIDNYGTQTAVKYLFEFKDWFEANTEGVLIVQIRDNGRDDPIREVSQKGLNKFLTPLGNGYYSIAEAKDMSNDYLLEFVQEWYKGPIEIVPIEYPRETSDRPASLSWHLTQREKNNILSCLDVPQNQQSFQMIEAWYRDYLVARGKF